MGIIKIWGQEVRWGKHLRLEAPINQTAVDNPDSEVIEKKVLDEVANDLATVMAPVQGIGRQTHPDNKTLIQVLGDLMLVNPTFEIELLNALEHLAIHHPDVSAAVDIISLANTGFTTYFDSGVPESMEKEMLQVLHEARDTWYPYADGINGAIDDWLTQCAITGAISHEWIIGSQLEGVASVVPVSPYNIVFHYDEKELKHIPVQKIPNSFSYSGPAILGKYKKLNTITYRYSAMRRIGESPYAIPPFLSSLESIIVQKNMVGNIAKIIEKLGVLGFLKVMMNAPTITQGEKPEAYQQRLKNELSSNVGELKKGLMNGVLAGWKGLHEIDMQKTNENVSGAESLMKMNDRLVLQGLKQPLELHNRENTSSETFGRVMLAKMSKNLTKYQSLVAKSLAYGDLLHLRLMGYPVKQVINEFEPVMLGDKKTEEEAYGKKIDNATKLYNAGVISQMKRANMLGFDEPDQEEPREMETPAEEGSGKPGDKGDGTKMPKKTEANKHYQFDIPEQFQKLLIDSPESGMGYHVVDIQTNVGEFKNVIVTNCSNVSFAAWTKVPIKSITGLTVKKKHELVDFFANSLSKNTPEYWGYKDEHEHHAHTEHFGVPKKEEKFWNRYRKDVNAAWKHTVDEIQEAIIANLIQVTEGVSVQAMEGNVLYHVYSKVEDTFVPLIKPIVQKHVREVYDYYRRSKAPWEAVASGKKDIPDAVFNLLDIRAMEFYKNSDELYMGKFVTDADTRKRMTSFIKEKYINQNTEIGRNEEGIKQFATEFSDLLINEDWKLRRIIDTTVNNMRNTATINYMDQAGVDEFKISGVTDRLQCQYCKTMHGKVFTVSREVEKIERVVSSPPEELPNIKPFITALKISIEDISEMSGEALQDLGIGAPSFHANCRCTTVVNL